MSARHVVPTCTLGAQLSLGYQTFIKIDQKILCLRLDLEAEEVLTFFWSNFSHFQFAKKIFSSVF